MTKILMTTLMTAAFTSSVYASILTTTPGTQNIEGIQIANEGTVAIQNQQTPVSIVGAGLRSKRVAIVKVKVYVAELLSSDASKFIRTESDALNSLEQSRTIALRLTFVRGVDAPTVQTSFAEALKANNVNIQDGSISQFLKAVADGGDAVAGKTLTIATQKNADKTETVLYEDSNGKVTQVNGPEGFSRQLMSIWLGNPSDSGVADLKKQLIQGL